MDKAIAYAYEAARKKLIAEMTGEDKVVQLAWILANITKTSSIPTDVQFGTFREDYLLKARQILEELFKESEK